MKKLLLVLALLLIPISASAQCNGVFPTNSVCGSAAGGIPTAIPFASLPGPCPTLGAFQVGIGSTSQCSTVSGSAATINNGSLVVGPTFPPNVNASGLPVSLTLNHNSIAPPPLDNPGSLGAADYLTQIIGKDNFSAGINMMEFGTSDVIRGAESYPGISFHRGDGTAAAPTAVSAGDVIGHLGAHPYSTTTWSAIAPGRIRFYAEENHSDTNQGTSVRIDTTAIGSPGSAHQTTVMFLGATTLLGGLDKAAPAAETLTINSVIAGTSNTAGANLTFDASKGTGTGAGGDFVWRVALAGGAGSTQNSLTELMRLSTAANSLNIGGGSASSLGQINAVVPSGGIASLISQANSATGVDSLQINSSDGNNIGALNVYERSRTGTFLGITTGNWVGLQSVGANSNGLLIGTALNGNTPVVFGTNNTERMRLTLGLSVGLTIDPGVGIVSALTGFRVNNAATSGNVLRGNGTNFVSAQLACADLSTPCITGNQTITLSGDTTGSGTTAITTTTGKVNGVAYGTNPSTNTVPVVTSANTVTYEAIPNAALANSTISGVALGSTLSTLTFGTHLTSGGASYNGSAGVTITSDATNANTASTIVARDGSGNFSAGTIAASLTGHASLDLALTGGTMSGAIAMGTNAITGLTTLASAGAMTFQSNGSTAAGNINTSQQWTLGNGTPTTGPIVMISAASGTPSNIETATSLHVVGPATAINRVIFDAYNGTNQYYFRRANTSQSAPSALTAGSQIMSLLARGYGATGYIANGATAGILAVAGETWTDSTALTYLDFYTTPTGSTTIAQQVRIQGSGGVSIGTTTDPGIGSLQLNAQMFMPNITTSSAAQNGTVCWTTGTGKFTVDTTVGCLTSIMAAKNVTERLSPAKALDIVAHLDPFAFRYKNGYGDSGHYEQFGLGAEEVMAVDERLVGRDPEGKLQGVRYQELTAVLAGAIHNLNNRLSQLEHSK